MARIWSFGSDVNTDLIVPGRYAPYVTSDAELRTFPFVEARPEFAKEVAPGDVLVAGPNFGCGSSREYAALALRLCELGAIVAPSFARIFFRNALNLGLPLYEADARVFADGERVELDHEAGILRSADGRVVELPKPGAFERAIWSAGGMVPWFRAHGRFPESVPS